MYFLQLYSQRIRTQLAPTISLIFLLGMILPFSMVLLFSTVLVLSTVLLLSTVLRRAITIFEPVEVNKRLHLRRRGPFPWLGWCSTNEIACESRAVKSRRVSANPLTHPDET